MQYRRIITISALIALTTAALRLSAAPPTAETSNIALSANGTTVATDSFFRDAYEKSSPLLIDGINTNDGLFTSTWASAERDEPHWVELTLPRPTQVDEVRIYWALYQDQSHVSRHHLIQAWQNKAWKTIIEISNEPDGSCKVHTFPALTTSKLRIWQPTGGGSAGRPDLMWLGEIEVFRAGAPRPKPPSFAQAKPPTLHLTEDQIGLSRSMELNGILTNPNSRVGFAGELQCEIRDAAGRVRAQKKFHGLYLGGREKHPLTINLPAKGLEVGQYRMVWHWVGDRPTQGEVAFTIEAAGLRRGPENTWAVYGDWEIEKPITFTDAEITVRGDIVIRQGSLTLKHSTLSVVCPKPGAFEVRVERSGALTMTDGSLLRAERPADYYCFDRNQGSMVIKGSTVQDMNLLGGEGMEELVISDSVIQRHHGASVCLQVRGHPDTLGIGNSTIGGDLSLADTRAVVKDSRVMRLALGGSSDATLIDTYTEMPARLEGSNCIFRQQWNTEIRVIGDDLQPSAGKPISIYDARGESEFSGKTGRDGTVTVLLTEQIAKGDSLAKVTPHTVSVNGKKYEITVGGEDTHQVTVGTDLLPRLVRLSRAPWGHDFAFTIVDDPDGTTGKSSAWFYDYLHQHGMKTTRAAFAYSAGKRGADWRDPGYLDSDEYREWLLDLQRKGFEIAMHSPSDRKDEREKMIEAYQGFREIFGHTPHYVQHQLWWQGE